MRRASRTLISPLVVVLALAGCGKAPAPSGDEKSLRALDAAYVEAWLKDDAERQKDAVLALFQRDAVILPGGGLSPEEGVENIKKFWFPEGAGQTLVTHFTRDIDAVDVSGGLGVVSGRYTLSFIYEGQSMTQAGNYMFVAEATGSGWRITRMIWNDQPLTEV
jgi:ketosteroid isomerase-like protein